VGEAKNLQGAKAGQFTLNDWLGQQNNAASPKGVLPFILPVQEMRPFQRRYAFTSGNQALLITERVQVRWEIPDFEFWKVLGIFWENPDNIDHSYSIVFTINRSSIGDQGGSVSQYRVALMTISGQANKVIYGLDIQTRTNTDLYHQFLDITLEPGDAISITMNEDANVATSARWTMLYELMPGPPERRVKGLDSQRIVT